MRRPSRRAPRRAGGRGRREAGQATVELALLLPVVCALLVLALEVGLAVRAQLLLAEVTREVARQASLGPAGADAVVSTAELARRVGLDPQRLEVRTDMRTDMDAEPASSAGLVTVVATYRQPFAVPMFALGQRTLTLRIHLTVREEAT